VETINIVWETSKELSKIIEKL